MEGNSSGIGSNTTRMLPSAQFWRCANSWRRNWRNRYQFESGLVFGFKRLSNEAMSVIGCTFRTWGDARLDSAGAQERTLLLRAMRAGNYPRRAMAPPDTEEENVEAG